MSLKPIRTDISLFPARIITYLFINIKHEHRARGQVKIDWMYSCDDIAMDIFVNFQPIETIELLVSQQAQGDIRRILICSKKYFFQ